MTRDEQLIKAVLDMAAMAAVTTPESRPGAPREWSDGFTSGCLHSADAIRAIAPADVLAKVEAVEADAIQMTYRNYRGEVSRRTISPISIWFGTTDWHPEPGWLLSGIDMDKCERRDFALADCQFADLSPAPDAVTRLVEAEKDKACRLLISGFMLDCNAIGYIAAAENLVRGIKEYVALAACKGVRDE